MAGVRDRSSRGLAALLVAVAALVASGPAGAAAPKGFDISHWNGAIDWIQVATGGYTFVFAKATEGRTLTDPTYGINRSGANAFGLRLGAYHFARPSGSGEAALAANAIAQADHFVEVAQPVAGDLPPALDLETNGGLGAASLSRWTQIFLDHVEARTGVKALVYASPNFWKTSLADTSSFALTGHRLWIAHWTKNAAPLLPAGSWGGGGWTFWQWTNCSSIPGFAHCADGDRFNGSDVSSVTISSVPTGAPQAAQPPAVVGVAQVGKLLAALPGGWSGGKPLAFTYQWQSCDAAGSGCIPITGATGESYTPTLADAGHAIVVSVSGQNGAGTATQTSAPTLAVAAGSTGGTGTAAPQAISQPSVGGTAQVGQTLSALIGTWSGSPSRFAFQWRRCNAGGTCTDVSGANEPQYVVSPGDVGSTLILVVSATGPGGTASTSSPATAAVVPAPLPAPAVGSAGVDQGAAGAVTTADHAATVSWQPGSAPVGSTVTLRARRPKLALKGTGVALGIAPLQTALQWPVDLSWAAAPANAVVGISSGGAKGFEAVPALASPALGTDQRYGSYRDGSGVLHVLTKEPGTLALFAAGKWGDPRRVSAGGPSLTRHSGKGPLNLRGRKDGTALVVVRLDLSSQAHLYAMLRSKGGVRVPVLKTGSRLGVWLKGGASKTVQSLARTPGALPVRLRISPKQLRAHTTYELRVAAVGPYGRRSEIVLPVRVP